MTSVSWYVVMSFLLILMYRHVVNTKRSKEMALEDPASVVEMASKKVSWCHGRPFVFSRLELPPPKDLLVSDSWGIPAIPTFVWSASSLDALRVENSKICEVWTAPFPTPTSCSKNPSNIGGWQSHWACRNQRSGCPGPIVASTNQREGSTSVAPFRKGAPYATAQPESSQFGWQCSACLDWPHEALKKGRWWYGHGDTVVIENMHKISTKLKWRREKTALLHLPWWWTGVILPLRSHREFADKTTSLDAKSRAVLDGRSLSKLHPLPQAQECCEVEDTAGKDGPPLASLEAVPWTFCFS